MHIIPYQKEKASGAKMIMGLKDEDYGAKGYSCHDPGAHLWNSMVFREAATRDIGQIRSVRFSVRENVLINPALATEKDCEDFLTVRGKGWVCEVNELIAGFAVADLKDHNIWALFVRPEYESKGIGRRLQGIMLDWYFSQSIERVWLSTDPGTRAELFYRKSGWREAGVQHNGELRFEMTPEDWEKIHNF